MYSRDTIVGIGYFLGLFSLFVGVMGQAVFLSPVTSRLSSAGRASERYS
jgi:hypothetical protein